MHGLSAVVRSVHGRYQSVHGRHRAGPGLPVGPGAPDEASDEDVERAVSTPTAADPEP